MSDTNLIEYVKASASLHGVPLDDQRASAVAAHLGRTAELAQLLNDLPLHADDELVEIYCPAAFVRSSKMDSKL